jgi:hypothetical protein
VQSFSTKITKSIHVIKAQKREHNAALKKRHHGGAFFGPKKT